MVDERSMESWIVLYGLDNYAHTHLSLTKSNMTRNLEQPPSSTEEKYPAWDMIGRGRTCVSQRQLAPLDQAVHQCQATLTWVSTGPPDGHDTMSGGFFSNGPCHIFSGLACSSGLSVLFRLLYVSCDTQALFSGK